MFYKKLAVAALLAVVMAVPGMTVTTAPEGKESPKSTPTAKEDVPKPKFVTRDAFKVVGLRYVGKNEHGEISDLWDQFLPKFKDIKNLVNSKIALGISECICKAECKCGQGAEFAYMACAEVTSFDSVPEGMVTKTIPAARYAIYTHKGPVEALPKTLGIILSKYLPATGLIMSGTYTIEVYDERLMNEANPQIDIYIPVEAKVKPKIVKRDSFRVVGLRYIGDGAHGEIGETWDKFLARQNEVKNQAKKGVCYGIADAVSVMACAEVNNLNDIPEGMVGHTVPEATYAVFTYRGPIEGLGRMFDEIYSKWLPVAGLEPAADYHFELYDERFNANSEIDLYIPIKTGSHSKSAKQAP